jgi:hypothetical protein
MVPKASPTSFDDLSFAKDYFAGRHVEKHDVNAACLLGFD